MTDMDTVKNGRGQNENTGLEGDRNEEEKKKKEMETTMEMAENGKRLKLKETRILRLE